MKKICYFIITSVTVLSMGSCKKYDNYTAPAETLTGRILDKNTGQPLQMEQGSSNTRLALYDLTWGTTTGKTVLPIYFDVKYEAHLPTQKCLKEAIGYILLMVRLFRWYIPIRREQQ